ncbi:hypothetical protein T03_5647, partial [Trichinella britovi]
MEEIQQTTDIIKSYPKCCFWFHFAFKNLQRKEKFKLHKTDGDALFVHFEPQKHEMLMYLITHFTAIYSRKMTLQN